MKNKINGAIIIIGDTMERSYNLIDIEFAKLSKDEKRQSFMMMDLALKEIHKKNYKVDSFAPSNIYYKDGIYFYDEVTPINTNVDTKEDAVLDDIIGLSNLAFCSYLPSYDLSNGLLNGKVVSEQFDKFTTIFDSDDRDYYKAVLVDAYQNHKLPEKIYYSDYIMEKEKNGTSKSDNKNLTKSTLAGKLYMDDGAEAGFSRIFFLSCMVTSMIIAFIGLALYFLK